MKVIAALLIAVMLTTSSYAQVKEKTPEEEAFMAVLVAGIVFIWVDAHYGWHIVPSAKPGTIVTKPKKKVKVRSLNTQKYYDSVRRANNGRTY